MTFLSPTFIVKNLKVYQHGHEAFSCSFHKGLNILSGRNSSGKTTIMDLLAYSLGAENIKWKPEALLCTNTIVEVLLNDKPTCFKREISEESLKPLSIFWGGLDAALSSSPNQWETYPFRRSEKSMSFSQVILNSLSMPVAQGEGASILTMHQLLRVMYADQPSVHSPIFRVDSFDKALTRETVGDYLCGVYDDKLYTSQVRLKQVDSELSKKVSELKSIFLILGRSGQSENIHYIDEKISQLNTQREKLLEDLSILRTSGSSGGANNSDKEKTDSLRKRLDKAKAAESKVVDEINRISLDIFDSEMFIKELKERIDNLNESSVAREYFSGVSFQFCPSCLSEIVTGHDNDCHLCKTSIPDGDMAPQLLRMKNELAVQLKESNYLLELKNKELAELKLAQPALRKEVKKLSQEYSLASSSWESPYEIEFGRISKSLGSVEEEINQAYEHLKLKSAIAELQSSRDLLQAEKESLESVIESLQNREEKTKLKVSQSIEIIMIRLLKMDLELQVEFINAKQVKFSFEDNTVYVNGSKNFSESSAVILRHIFHLSLLTASLEMKFMRLPRFIMLDGIDDGGMEKGRSHRLQKIIVDEVSKYEHDFQLIFATSDISPDLEGTEFTVGRYFRPEARSLNVSYAAINADVINSSD
ncbi:TPA: AAA family ATPase [Yersinia enterocolitica]|nr:AAA family ATPase [Yersinia enterocolitica]HDL7433313.1 AAA family ATPase [Yersinia enterocolitica]HDL7475722.1 AAA family ATPase [Yersinia enterocolitica]